MNVLDGIKNVLSFINDNWTGIVIVIGLLIMVWQKIEKYLNLSTQEKIDIAKEQLSETILKLISDAEVNYAEWVKAGSIKRAEVIDKIFKDYPILSKVTNQEELIKWIDEEIDKALITLREIVKETKDKENE